MTRERSRRAFLRDAGVGALGFCVGGQLLWLTPAEARDADVPLRVLSADQAATFERFAERLVPDSAAAGVSHFLDHQLGAPEGEQLLTIRYLGVEAPFQPFYAGGLAALDAVAQARHQRAFTELDDADAEALARAVAAGNPEGWNGPPAAFFAFVARSDALDVVYGTPAGFERLGIPYMAHIEPPSRWGES